MSNQSFAEQIRFEERAVEFTNWCLDHWWLGVLGLLLWALYSKLRGTHQLLGELDERCTAAFADIDTLLSQRHDLVLNLVETVKGFATQEHKVLTEVVEARARAMANVGSVRYAAENQIGQSLNSLFNLTENYPELESSSHFTSLRTEMTRMEDRITAARRFYNLAVEELYGFSRSFPANMLAGIANIGKHEKFTLGEQRAHFEQRVAVSFAA